MGKPTPDNIGINSKHRQLSFQVQHQQIDKTDNKMKEMKITIRRVKKGKKKKIGGIE
jgi:hypothetical protein